MLFNQNYYLLEENHCLIYLLTKMCIFPVVLTHEDIFVLSKHSSNQINKYVYSFLLLSIIFYGCTYGTIFIKERGVFHGKTTPGIAYQNDGFVFPRTGCTARSDFSGSLTTDIVFLLLSFFLHLGCKCRGCT